jgi:enolase
MVKTSKIKTIKAREILDSRGRPTVEVGLTTDLGIFRASVPSGTSKGKYEAVEKKSKTAIKNVNKIIGPKLKGKDVTYQKEIDTLVTKLDGTKNKSKLGANAILAVSMAVCRAGAEAKKIPLWKWISRIAGKKPVLPNPCILYLEGGFHGKGGIDIQEFMGLVKGSLKEKSFKEKFRAGTKIYHDLGEILTKKYGKKGARIGLEGGFIPLARRTEEALDLLMKAGQKKKIKIILDIAASSFFRKGKYYLEGKRLNRGELLDFYLKLCQKYPIIAIEDPFNQEDWGSFQKITKKIGRKVTIIGDDLLVTNIKRIKKAVRKKACNGLVLKPNQIGTVSETIAAAKYAFKNKWKVFVKHRSGETKDDFIADLAVGLGTGWIMAGAPSQKVRMAKYNRLLKIEREIKSASRRK